MNALNHLQVIILKAKAGGGHFLSFQPLPTPTNSKPPVKIGLKAVKATTVTE